MSARTHGYRVITTEVSECRQEPRIRVGMWCEEHKGARPVLWCVESTPMARSVSGGDLIILHCAEDEPVSAVNWIPRVDPTASHALGRLV